MADLPPALEKKVGPLPVWGWAGVAAVGVGLGLYLRSRATPNTDATNVIAPLADPAAVDPSTTYAGTGGAVPLPDNSSGVNTTVDVAPTDNEGWLHHVEEWLVGTGISPANADAALRNYLYGIDAGTQGRSIISLALRHAGSPPEGAPPIVGINPPSTVGPGYRPTYKSVAGDTWESVALRFYNSGDQWMMLAKANPGVHPNSPRNAKIPAGKTLVIPAATKAPPPRGVPVPRTPPTVPKTPPTTTPVHTARPKTWRVPSHPVITFSTVSRLFYGGTGMTSRIETANPTVGKRPRNRNTVVPAGTLLTLP